MKWILIAAKVSNSENIYSVGACEAFYSRFGSQVRAPDLFEPVQILGPKVVLLGSQL